MKKNNEFFVAYLKGSLGLRTKKIIKRFALVSILAVIASALLFSFSQKQFKNSTFELTSATEVTGTYYEAPYPMLRVEVAENMYKNILLLGFGKFSANPFLEKLRKEIPDLPGKTLRIEGNLIYYNGKTLIQITDEEKVTMVNNEIQQMPAKIELSQMTFKGEIIDPKCYFGVMKPGKGKIHRSCAVRCISGGIPPVLATTDENNVSQYFLLVDTHGAPINEAVLPYIGKPSEIKGIVEKMEDWYLLRINIEEIKVLDENSTIY